MASIVNREQRVYFLDYAKFIGIYLMVLGHLELPQDIKNSIYAFHMPLFFAISGYLFSFKKNMSAKDFILKRGKQLIIPYLIFNVITYIFWLFVGRKFGLDSTEDIKLYKPVIGIFYGNGNNNFLIHDTVLWFLPCLFIVETIYFIFFRNKTKIISVLLLCCFLAAGFLDYKFIKINLPWGIDTAFTAIVFYGLANLFKPGIIKLLNIPKLNLGILTIFLFLAFIYLSTLNGRVDMLALAYNNYPLFIFNALLGVMLCLLVSYLVSEGLGKLFVIEYIAKNTIIILAFHAFGFTIIKAVTYYLLKYPMSIYETNLYFNIFVAAITILILVPVMILWDRYFPAIIGIKPKAK
ncbi:acyltransferase family protein [Pedobacter petrophilus]|uniref:Acyltransferase family protein n=1 Tax=Pedobacter petrophilus TaxID=1908241 RepID=A0A7K0G309_9SPHI|nr:acyltransferase family protein [Pedobacter petrophilus]MRX78197.1 acyltransferase family protein [Pedobacter petrophilus]